MNLDPETTENTDPASEAPTPDEGPADEAKPARKTARKKSSRGRGKKKTTRRKTTGAGQKAPLRTQRSFPAVPFEDALELANTMQKMGSNRVRRLTLFEELGRSAESGPSRQQITNSGRYGITTGGYQAEWIELTEQGQRATSPETPPRQRLRGRYALAIESIPPFKALYDEFVGKKLPSQSVMRDFLRDLGLPDSEIQECIDTFIVNAKFVGLLRPVAGSERLLSLDHAADELGPAAQPDPATVSVTPRLGESEHSPEGTDWSKVCFYVSPIGDEDTESRRHSDLFLGSLVEPALQEFDLRVIRADQIGQAGMITAQIIEHLARSRIVIADLSLHNPNVFYEVALRHALRRPIVQLIRASDRIPFDLDQVRTIKIDTSDIYSLVPQIETYRSEISTQVRRALDAVGEVENPLTVFYPSFWDSNDGS